MSRSVDMWVGATDDTPAPPRVRLRVWERRKGLCHRCGRLIRAGEKWTLEHLVAVILGGRNAEDNMGLTCSNCLAPKNAEDMAAKSKIADIRKKHLLPKERGRGFRKLPPGFKYSWRTGRVERVE